RYEPVLRFTRGELFLPMSVPAYLERCGLWQSAESGRSRRRRAAAVRLCAPGELTPERLAASGAAPHVRDLSLRFVERPLTRSQYRSWRSEPGRARLAPGSGRFAVVGLLGRLIDAGFRLALGSLSAGGLHGHRRARGVPPAARRLAAPDPAAPAVDPRPRGHRVRHTVHDYRRGD